LNRRWWLQLERWERGIVKATGKAIGFTGPVFGEDDPVDREIVVSKGRLVAKEPTRIPRCYWKLVLANSGDNCLQLGAFCLDQFELIENNARRIDLDNHRIAATDLEKRTGLIFCNSIHNAAALY
jgi:DNA/RNA endonuclease G (NUC1)